MEPISEAHVFDWTLATAQQLSLPKALGLPKSLDRTIYRGLAVYMPGTKEVRPLQLSSLPRDPMKRFEALFKVKKKWPEEEMKPFLEGLVSATAKKGKGLDALLLKYTRTQQGPKGETVYTGRNND